MTCHECQRKALPHHNRCADHLRALLDRVFGWVR